MLPDARSILHVLMLPPSGGKEAWQRAARGG